MFLFYIDETGNRDPRLEIPQKNGTVRQGEWLYVLTAVGMFEQRWHTLEKPINRMKMKLIENIRQTKNIDLDLADAEIKSTWVRQPRKRQNHPFLKYLTDEEIHELITLYYDQLANCRAQIFAVLVDKRQLRTGTTQAEILRKSWERLLELIEQFMRLKHDKHQAIIINDDVSKQVNQSLAMEHARLLDRGTERELWLRHICEMPMFVRSELSNGVQLTDLCSYNIYRAFLYDDLEYKKISPYIWRSTGRTRRPLPGLYVFPERSPLREQTDKYYKKRASTQVSRGS